MKYAVEMGSAAMIYIRKFHKDWFRHSKVDGGGGFRHIDIQHGARISLLSFFFQNKESKLINWVYVWGRM
jgi:hypothetical protein